MAGRLHVGTSGYVYGHWRDVFYPRGVPVRDWLPYYARHFATVELNAPFYRLPEAATFRAWRRAVPPGFVFAVKASRYLTHVKRLRTPGRALRRFFSRVRALEGTLGPVLFQLPPHFHADVARLEHFLALLARQRQVAGLRAALEVRHASWLAPAVLDRLRAANVALCFHDWRDAPVSAPVTADFVYVRRHGTRRYAGLYTSAMLRRDAAAVRRWLQHGRDVYVYFNNDARGAAVKNALVLHALVNRPPRRTL